MLRKRERDGVGVEVVERQAKRDKGWDVSSRFPGVLYSTMIWRTRAGHTTSLYIIFENMKGMDDSALAVSWRI